MHTPIAALVRPLQCAGYGQILAIGNAGEMYATALPGEIVVHLSGRWRNEIGGSVACKYMPTEGFWNNTGRPYYYEPEEMSTYGT